MDWKNVDLNSPYERDQGILDEYDFNKLILELYSNYPKEKLSKGLIIKHVHDAIQQNVKTAEEIIVDNAENVLNHVKKLHED